MKQFIVDRHTTPNTPTLEQVPTEKIPIYENRADLDTDLANLAEGQIVATKDTGAELSQPVDVVQSGNLHAVTSNAVAESFFKELWTNPNPASGFNQQDITIPNLTSYRFIILLVRWATFNDTLAASFFIDPKSANNGEIWVTSFDGENNIMYNCDRIYHISGNNISIQNGILWLGAVKNSVRNDLCIPYKILGIR